ncbi:hypothetical protein ILUMI_02442 [Ignelater luminosus]|uniref:Fascin-like domain-containing protein n=1 Tax=Ignelater luminosus TaxID=2038154 RepID=A0A8K0GKU2_IGNLU|nr:hypothetical protein ILUMI_02442 [Ignelater luminosus]
MKINLDRKSSTASLISYDSHTKKSKETASCNLEIETFINDKKDTNNIMDCTIKKSSVGKGYKMPSFLTGFHHKAYLENVQTNHGKLRINRYKHSNPMLPPIPYLTKRPRVPLSPRLKLNLQKYEENQKVIHISRSTSPINFNNENGDSEEKVNVDDFPNEVPVNAEEQIFCLEQIEKQFRSGLSNETVGDGDKRKEKVPDIPKDIPLQLLNQSQRLKIKKRNENIESLERKEKKIEIPEFGINVDEDSERRFYKNINVKPHLKPANDVSDNPKKSVLQQILYFNEKSKCNNEGNKITTEKNAKKSPRGISSELYRNYGLDRWKDNMKSLEMKDSNESFESEPVRDSNNEDTASGKKITTTVTTTYANESNGNSNKARVINDLFKEHSSGSLSSASSLQFSNHTNFGKDKNENISLKKDRRINQNEPKSSKVIDGTNSIIDSIKSKFFKTSGISRMEREKPTKHVELENQESNLKFPKETRNAVMLLMNNNNKEVKFAVSKENIEQQKVKHYNHRRYHHHYHNQASEVQIKRHPEYQTLTKTSYARANVNVFKNSSHLPCPKNLLCEKGVHRGKCGKLCGREMLICENRCECRKMSYWCPECQNVWPGSAKRCEKNDNDDDKGKQELTSNRMDGNFFRNEDCFNSVGREVIPITTNPSKMNGMNGHANGELNGCDIITQNQQKGCWTIGLINSKFRYLTAETFGFKINANGASLKKKQIWTLEPDQANGGESYIYLRSHLDKYLAVDSFGNVTCESDEKDPGCKFQISVAEDGSGRWAFRNVVRGYFLGSSSDKLTCTAKVPGDAEFWHVHLAARPQVNLRSVGRKRFAHLSENLDEIHVDANIPWGEDTLFTLEFRADESGKYALHTCNNKYLSLGGKLVDTCNKDCLFTAEYHSGQLALRDRNGAYLSPIGSKAVLKTRSNTVTKDELFSLEDSLPQASFVAALNSRYVSVKQGVDVTANQDEISDHETFQLEFDWSTKRWYIRTMQDRYWTLETGGGIQAVGDKRSSNALFDLIWQGDGSVAFRANNGRYVITKRSGHLYATADTIDDNCKYFFYLINRPILVLKSEQGFVGYKSASSPKLECNKATYETIQVERAEKGVIYFKGQNGKYWHCDSEGVTADSDTPEGFYLELREPTRLSIKSVTGSYLTASKNGTFRLGESSFEAATQWEY